MKVHASAIETRENVKYIVCAVENGGGMFRMPLPDGEQGKSIESMVNLEGSVVHLELDKDSNDSTWKIVAVSAVA